MYRLTPLYHEILLVLSSTVLQNETIPYACGHTTIISKFRIAMLLLQLLQLTS
jgi:hypothetical protein